MGGMHRDADHAMLTEPPEATRSHDGPGMLILVVGPSGAGKDTLLTLARHVLPPGASLLYAKRLVTRPEAGDEDHLCITEQEFVRGQISGAFALSWRAHGLGYALGPEVKCRLQQGHIVVANGSRATLAQAHRDFPNLRVVLVTAPPQVLACRLAARARENPEDIRERLERPGHMPVPPDLIIENTGAPQAGAERLAAFIAAQVRVFY